MGEEPAPRGDQAAHLMQEAHVTFLASRETSSGLPFNVGKRDAK